MKTKRINLDVFPVGAKVWTITMDDLVPVEGTITRVRIDISEETIIQYFCDDLSQSNIWPFLNPTNTFGSKIEAENYSREKHILFKKGFKK